MFVQVQIRQDDTKRLQANRVPALQSMRDSIDELQRAMDALEVQMTVQSSQTARTRTFCSPHPSVNHQKAKTQKDLDKAKAEHEIIEEQYQRAKAIHDRSGTTSTYDEVVRLRQTRHDSLAKVVKLQDELSRLESQPTSLIQAHNRRSDGLGSDAYTNHHYHCPSDDQCDYHDKPAAWSDSISDQDDSSSVGGASWQPEMDTSKDADMEMGVLIRQWKAVL